ncbi:MULTISPECIES: 4Fe-4S dicluster domain-containing protein [Desulfovibrio]|uniref:Dimethyl sulfoxide reductase, chain B n=2 Tax=root TaxID=1 RepID=A0A212JZ67_9BACT|nr:MULTISPECIES: 4Fe-4S dicluster domain-containing protein [Desulfovibrio]MBT9750005.1 4Fe-4S dicluster domain-containing protein [Desulfovibrio desulfuricans]MCB6541158.1 4Fe-4S dicluster domain-containing protein [Desulfovibrio desulfuricans]MCB6552240.1 4Fe-4S dicluster domain-containing protein [Desulfovibrio desulfuricans]MCB6564083.1 4Fe-4S dicluster domain-containing protein [Desulfovibrio desulfuricans]MCB7345263.1 4Fe-4S dicluster domain-containing protein [Desulfovibrio desulfurican
MSKRRAFLMDMDKCIGCRSCAMACKNFNQLEPDMVWRQVYPLDEAIYPHHDRAFLSLACNHCEHPACMDACPTSSYEKRPDGVVVHHKETCIGCTNCIRSCPYGAPRFNKAEKHAEKCSMCHERLDAGLLPACVQGCPTGALELVDLEQFDDTNAVQNPAGYPAMPRLNPSTRFILPRMPRQVRG